MIQSPSVVDASVANGLHQQFRRGQLTASEADALIARFQTFQFTLAAPSGLYRKALNFARTNSLAATYDSLDVVLAQILGAEIWTADQRLLRAVGSPAPWVRLIGDYPL
ncbi:MAG: type II toxin-antitoxin system VapC family toxin [Dehalococcoidia bacterium]